MKALLLLVLGLAFSSLVSAQLTWQSCGEVGFTLNSLSITPEGPVRGDDLTLTASMHFATPVHAGKAILNINYGLVSLPEQTISLCGEKPCPLSSLVTLHKSLPLSDIPAGKYTGKVVFINQDNVQFGCYSFTFNLGSIPKTAYASTPLIDETLIKTINQQGSWKATRYSRFENMTLADAKRMLSQDSADVSEYPRATLSTNFAAPVAFDSRTHWPGCVHAIRDQGSCGSCWAFGSSEALSDRFCIASKGQVNLVLSPQYQVSCDKTNAGCNGGNIVKTWNFLASTGTVSEECYPYASASGYAPGCITQCKNGSPLKFYKARNPKTVGSEALMMDAIAAGGPVGARFDVYQDFYNYHSGVYAHTTGAFLGGHAIKVVGWGVDGSGTKYWIIANSWGSSWALDGYFWMKKGVNMCGIEASTIAADAAL